MNNKKAFRWEANNIITIITDLHPSPSSTLAAASPLIGTQVPHSPTFTTSMVINILVINVILVIITILIFVVINVILDISSPAPSSPSSPLVATTAPHKQATHKSRGNFQRPTFV